jgi:hypothetical protein
VGERAVLLLAVAAAFANAFAGSFQFDDWNVIVRDPSVQSLAAWWRAMPGIRPLLKLSYAANHTSGLGLAGFHAVNVALHAASALLALALLRRLEARAVESCRGRGSLELDAPLAAALLFALHPAQTEAVTYLSGRSTALAATFVLASALVHVAGRDGAAPRTARLLSPLLLAASLATKELALALPAVLVAIELADPRRPASLRAALRATAGHWLVAAAAVALYARSAVYAKLAGASLALRGPGENALAHLHGLAWLAGQALRPDLLDADPVIPAATRLDATAAAAALALAAALAGGIVLLRRRPAEATALLWSVLWLPAAGLVLPRPEPANDRQLYLALLGPAWLLARGAVALGRRLPALRVPASATPLALAAALGLATAARNGVYADELGFWRAALARSPSNARALNNLGFALAARCRLHEAEEAFERAAAAAPGDFLPRVNLRLLRDGEPLGEGEPRCGPRPPPP